MTKTVLLITHEQTSSTDTGIIGQALLDGGHVVKTHEVFSLNQAGTRTVNTEFPHPGDFDAVIAFGSFSHIYEITEEWITREIEYIAALHQQRIPYLGICFGAQLLAESLGGRTVRADRIEAGLISFEPGHRCPIVPGPWFSWHSDRVELPGEIDVLAKTAIAPQVFRSERSIGVQFHPEVDGELMEEWIRIGGHELEGVLDVDDLRRDWAAHEPSAERNARELLDWFLGDTAPVEVPGGPMRATEPKS
ncbi:type 1 glutamine amidotransferase [Arthrobacter sp. B2a2-09]|uniref:type 1 glutamine amidotransferase n=1 Tax=Arthrobacter sp. B2a2-09 TaxID=2952822 RepID=UPI0022CDA6FC|nr:gamma-glutamyl-gamma-aminobutyrate hydrolase family protein [Arthrobacter sp. B2a2-09]MCZ9882578.1 gamma-glutamyl-gamma-aminobutyrate hydrolase family protein [Arthrobacter sp. B2a2-09]